jgi:hypothetical protein
MRVKVEITVEAENRDYDTHVSLNVMYVDRQSLLDYGNEAVKMTIANTEATLAAALESVRPALDQSVYHDSKQPRRIR